MHRLIIQVSASKHNFHYWKFLTISYAVSFLLFFKSDSCIDILKIKVTTRNGYIKYVEMYKVNDKENK